MVGSGERRIALFIDFENLVTNTGISPSTFDLEPSADLQALLGVHKRWVCNLSWSYARSGDAKVLKLTEEADTIAMLKPVSKSASNERTRYTPNSSNFPNNSNFPRRLQFPF